MLAGNEPWWRDRQNQTWKLFLTHSFPNSCKVFQKQGLFWNMRARKWFFKKGQYKDKKGENKRKQGKNVQKRGKRQGNLRHFWKELLFGCDYHTQYRSRVGSGNGKNVYRSPVKFLVCKYISVTLCHGSLIIRPLQSVLEIENYNRG